MTFPATDPATLTDSPAPRAARIALVGIHGFGLQHRKNLARLQAAGIVELVAAADPNPPADGDLPDSARAFGTLDELLAGTPGIDVVIIATPIQTHAPLAVAALEAGADVYLEKPPVASFAQFEEVLAAAERTGRAVQVGFQSLGSRALPALAETIASGSLGSIRAVTATGLWVRSRAYYARSRWAGKRTLDGTDVVDGVATNALAHAVATALAIAGVRTADQVAGVDTELYRANPVEADDTSVIRIRPVHAPAITCALTLCAEEQSEPYVTVHGTEGSAVFYYTSDVLDVTAGGHPERDVFGRVDLLENLLEHRSSGTGLLSPLAASGAFMRALEAIRTAKAPSPIDPRFVRWKGEAGNAHPVVAGIEQAVARACAAGSTFSELGLPWARPLEPAGRIKVGGRPVAALQDGTRIPPTSSPRPYLHPVSTPGGTVVTDHQPLDHVWHLGAGVALQDVDGVNFWGGRTYTREAGGYVWRPDHGRIRTVDRHLTATDLSEQLQWTGPCGAPVLNETRRWEWSAVDETTWRLRLAFELSPAGTAPVQLGSPGSNGRTRGGYGGFFWRFPPCRNIRVRTADAVGEQDVHGSVSRWLAWTADFDGGTATVMFLAPQESADPWFVRVADYPGAGSALAWDTPVSATNADPVRRTITTFIADGELGAARITELGDLQ
ncbi:Gfo/Idh/MocA family oxidoreductase [Paenarthrobacter sp. DKR-5]|uniref:DUF6807 family protein n=1 Tax=Paenarthrobacter sp. DKR-5 TaxID=2835535 RepID=UPI001BDCABD6|nr:DUF6807 family protein [Paenarthrobacter sp. DKR-5]MBT1001304.1 Gfo/Idh/MocA family oxidoreductase [Paenarthrobacter sp. DKR-5]